MITYIEIDGFKSFKDFKMEFTPLTVIAGANAAGKSNLFDAFRLLSSLAETDKIQKAFQEQRGDLLELFTRYDDQTVAEYMSFVVEMLTSRTVTDAWGATEHLKYTRLRYELKLHRFENSISMQDVEVVEERLTTIKHESDKWIGILPQATAGYWRPKVSTGRRQIPYIFTDQHNGVPTVFVPQDGTQGNKRLFPLNHASRTVLSSFDTVEFKHILAAKNEMKSWRFLQLNPEDLRLPSSKISGEDVISESGKNLAAAIYRLKQEDRYNLREISRLLHSFLPTFVSVDVVDDVENKRYIIQLKDVDEKFYTSRVLSEGTLRILALCVLRQDSQYKGMLCFEEPENGIHPFRIKMMTQLLRDLTVDFSNVEMPLRQVIINTHSANFIQEMNRWLSSDRNLSICFAQMVHSVFSVNGSRKQLLSSKVTSVPKGDNQQLVIPFTNEEKKMSIQMIKDFLQTRDSESI